ncbi:MAG: putative Ig domain-containing protein, partial [Bryobacteraceae bacterium]|nr:putative Ig domain-containing protein [Bryobacteraceae bacterium]
MTASRPTSSLSHFFYALALFSLPSSLWAQPTVTMSDNYTLFLGPVTIQPTATGGTAPYSWTVLDPLPAGLELRPDHPSGIRVWGVATTTGTTNVRFRVTDATSASAEKVVQIRIADLRELETFEYPDGSVGVSYSKTIAVAGGIPPFTFSWTGAPTGLSLDPATGAISGVPATAGVFNPVVVTVTDSTGISRLFNHSIRISPMRFLAGRQLPNAQIGTPYSQNIGFVGGTPPYTLSISGSLPGGLSASLSGMNVLVAGTPTGETSSDFRVTVTDNTGAILRLRFNVTVHDLVRTQPELTTGALVSTTVGNFNNFYFGVFRGTAPYTVSLASGSLPPGMAIEPDVNELFYDWARPLALLGAPSAVGTYNFVLKATDSSVPPIDTFRSYTIHISPLQVDFPAVPVPGAAFSGFLRAYGGKPGYQYSIVDGALPTGLTLDPTTGQITGITNETGRFDVRIRTTDSTPVTPNIDERVWGFTINLPGVTSQVTINNTGTIGTNRTGSATSRSFTASGGSGTFSWTFPAVPPAEVPTGHTAGPPPGMAFSTSGATATLIGTPTNPGFYAFYVRAADAANPANYALRQVRLQINALNFTWANPSVINVGTPIPTVTLTPSGVRAGATTAFSLFSGNFPAGLTLSPTGTITGTPTSTGAYFFQVRLTETLAGQPTYTYNADFFWQIYGVGITPPLNITQWPNGSRNRLGFWDMGLNASGGVPPYTFGLAPSAALIPNFRVSNFPFVPSWYGPGTPATLFGVSTTPGSYSSRLRVTDSVGSTFERDINFVVTPVDIVNWWIPETSAGQPYSVNFIPNGGTPPYTFSFYSAACPGFSISPTGLLTGTATLTCNHPIRVTDSAGNYYDRSYLMSVSPLRFVAPTPESRMLIADVNVAYSQTLAVAGGTAPYSYALGSGSALPGGLSLSAAGVLSGTPTGSTTLWGFSVVVTDSAGQTLNRRFQIYVRPALTQPLRWDTPSDLGSVTYGDDFGRSLYPSGGVPPYTYSVEGASPEGIQLAPAITVRGSQDPGAALISGRVRQIGLNLVLIRVTDSAGNSTFRGFTLSVSPLWAVNTSLPVHGATATVSAPFSQPLLIAGGTPPYTFSLVGLPPPGMTLAADGTLSGTPLYTGNQSYQFQVVDSAGGTRGPSGASLNVVAPGGATTLIFNQGRDLGVESTATVMTRNLTINLASGGAAPGPVDISLAPGSTLPPGLSLLKGNSLSNVGSTVWAVLTGRATTPGEYFFVLQAANAGGFGQQQFRLRVTPLTVNNAPTNVAAVGQTYTSAINLLNVTGTASFTLTSGVIPPGLTFNWTTGTFSGNPTTPGSYSFTFDITDAAGLTLNRTYTINVAPFSIATTAIPLAHLGEPYSFTLTANPPTPVSGTYSWSWSAGTSFAGGLTLNATTGVISGTPTFTTAFNVTVTLSNGTVSTTRNYRMVASNRQQLALPQFTTSPLLSTDGTVGASQFATFTFTGGTPPYTMSAPTPGLLPPGLSLRTWTDWFGTQNDQVWGLAGVPTANGVYNFPIDLTDGAGITIRRTFTVRIRNHRLAATSFPPGVYNQPYSRQLVAEGCSGSCTFEIDDIRPDLRLPPGLTLSSSGLISGTPLSTGSFSLWIKVTSAGQSSYFFITVTINGTSDGRQIAGGTGLIGVPYAVLGQTFSVSIPNSTGATWSLTPGSTLPPGVQLIQGTPLPPGLAAGSGIVAGVPTAAGTYTFGIRADDPSGNIGVRTHTLTVGKIDFAHNDFTPIPSAVFRLLPGRVGVPFSQSIPLANATAPVTFNSVSGTFLPPGVTLSSSGLLSGTPTEAGQFTIWIDVTDSTGSTARSSLSWSVFPAVGPTGVPLAGLVPLGYVAQPYSFDLDTLRWLGYGTGPYTWTLLSGELPAGLNLVGGGSSVSARISGIPTTTGTRTIYLRVNDSVGNSGSIALSITIYANPVTPIERYLPPAAVGVAYSQALTASGGTAPYTFTPAYFSSMPIGMSLSSAGVLSGTPIWVNNHLIRVDVVDAAGVQSRKDYLLRIGATTGSIPPNLTVSQEAIDLSYVIGGPAPNPVNLAIGSTGSGLSYSVSSSGGSWLTASPVNGTTPSAAVVSFNMAGLATGSYNGTITVTSAGAGNSPRNIPVRLVVSAPDPTAPLFPTSGAGATQTFTARYTSPNGFNDVVWGELLFAAAPDGGGQPFCFVHFDNAGNGLWLYDSARGFFAGPIAPGTASNVLQDPVCAISTLNSSVARSGNTVTLTVSLIFKANFARNVYLRNSTVSGGIPASRTLQGTWTLQSAPTGTPSGFSPTGSLGGGTPVQFTLTYPDTPGFPAAPFGW